MVLGERGRAHVWSGQGKLVTSLNTTPESIECRRNGICGAPPPRRKRRAAPSGGGLEGPLPRPSPQTGRGNTLIRAISGGVGRRWPQPPATLLGPSGSGNVGFIRRCRPQTASTAGYSSGTLRVRKRRLHPAVSAQTASTAGYPRDPGWETRLSGGVGRRRPQPPATSGALRVRKRGSIRRCRPQTASTAGYPLGPSGSGERRLHPAVSAQTASTAGYPLGPSGSGNNVGSKIPHPCIGSGSVVPHPGGVPEGSRWLRPSADATTGIEESLRVRTPEGCQMAGPISSAETTLTARFGAAGGRGCRRRRIFRRSGRCGRRRSLLPR